MLAKINHVAIVSDNYAQLAQFYEAAFGMRTSAKTRPGRAVTVGDGYVGLNINPRRAGRSAGLDHFAIGNRQQRHRDEDQHHRKRQQRQAPAPKCKRAAAGGHAWPIAAAACAAPRIAPSM